MFRLMDYNPDRRPIFLSVSRLPTNLQLVYKKENRLERFLYFSMTFKRTLKNLDLLSDLVFAQGRCPCQNDRAKIKLERNCLDVVHRLPVHLFGAGCLCSPIFTKKSFVQSVFPKAFCMKRINTIESIN